MRFAGPSWRAHQATNKIVYAFKPSEEKCCKRECFRYFQDPSSPPVVDARKPLAVSNMDRNALSTLLLQNISTYLCLPTDQKPCCVEMATRIYACSRSLLYKDTRPEQSRSEASSQCPKTVSLCAWFSNLKQTLDVMPDEGGWYMVNHPRKVMVYNEYIEDCQTWPTLYEACSVDLFNTCWRDNFPEIRLRKHCRFSKCQFCVRYRAINGNRNLADKTRLDAKNRLKCHYQWAHGRERGCYHEKRNKAVKHPSEYISISIDATDKYPNGFPHFVEKTKRDEAPHGLCHCPRISALHFHSTREHKI